jgi:hypothetical protein
MSRLAALINGDRELSARIEALMEERARTRADIAALCPAQPGTVHVKPDGTPMWVNRVVVRDTGDRYEWCLDGRKTRKDGTPHANAWAGCWIVIEEDQQ